MKLNNTNHIDKEIFWYGAYERNESFTFIQFLNPGAVCIDVGANTGYYSLMSAAHQPHCMVYAFEPASEMFKKLTENSALNGFKKITAVQKGVSNRSTKKQLFISGDDNTGMSSLSAAENATGKIEMIEVVSLDEFVEQKQITGISIIKIDVEGAEIEVLEGMKTVITSFRPLVAIEINAEIQGRFGQSINSIYSFMQERNYIAYEVIAVGCLKPVLSNKDCDLAFFIHEEARLPSSIKII